MHSWLLIVPSTISPRKAWLKPISNLKNRSNLRPLTLKSIILQAMIIYKMKMRMTCSKPPISTLTFYRTIVEVDRFSRSHSLQLRTLSIRISQFLSKERSSKSSRRRNTHNSSQQSKLRPRNKLTQWEELVTNRLHFSRITSSKFVTNNRGSVNQTALSPRRLSVGKTLPSVVHQSRMLGLS